MLFLLSCDLISITPRCCFIGCGHKNVTYIYPSELELYMPHSTQTENSKLQDMTGHTWMKDRYAFGQSARIDGLFPAAGNPVK